MLDVNAPKCIKRAELLSYRVSCRGVMLGGVHVDHAGCRFITRREMRRMRMRMIPFFWWCAWKAACRKTWRGLGGGSLLGALIIPSALTTTSASHQENEEHADEEKWSQYNNSGMNRWCLATSTLEMKTDESDVWQRPFIPCGLTSWDRQQNVRRSVLIRRTLVEH